MKRRSNPFLLLSLAGVLVLALQLALPLLASGRTRTDADALGAAEAAYDRGVELSVRDDDGAQARFLESADAFARAAGDEPAAALLYNRANALLRAGRVGEAIAEYRAAQARAPLDRRIAGNLAEARRKVTRPIAVPEPTALDRAAAAWSFLGERTRLVLAVVLLWTAVALLMLRRATMRAAAAGNAPIRASLALAALLAATVAADIARRTARDDAVVREPSTLRKGNGEGFEPVLGEELPEGTECRVLESRPGWLEIELGDGSTRGWLREGDLVRVR